MTKTALKPRRTMSDDGFTLPPAVELDRLISLQAAAKISNLSADSWKRNHQDKIIRLSPRRLGVRLRDALMLTPKKGLKRWARASRGDPLKHGGTDR